MTNKTHTRPKWLWSYMQSLQPGTMSTELHAITTACNHVYRDTCNHYSLQPWLQSYTQSLQSARKAAESCSSCCKFSDALWSARNKTESPLFKTENGATNIFHGAANLPNVPLVPRRMNWDGHKWDGWLLRKKKSQFTKTTLLVQQRTHLSLLVYRY